MTPRVAQTGTSFVGAGSYYLRDKEAQTKDRVEWTYTHNLPTDDPEKAMKMMAFTAMTRDQLKEQAGVAKTGRKSSERSVYSYSLAWHPEQAPEQQHMQDCSLETLELLGLSNHEAVLVAHNDTDHKHVHVIVSLVDPDNGKILRPQNDRLILSTWAEKYERETGKIYSPERVENNQRRLDGEKVKHREKQLEAKTIIQQLYQESKDSAAFQQSLKGLGYDLATGDRRGFVLVDQEGKISSLSRQLKGERAKDLRARLSDLKELPNGQELSYERQHFDREKYARQQEEKLIDAAIKAEEAKRAQGKSEDSKKAQFQKQEAIKKEEYQSFAAELDAQRKKEQAIDQARLQKQQQLDQFYDRQSYQDRLNELRSKLNKPLGFGKDKIRTEIQGLEKTLQGIDTRIQEQMSEFSKKPESAWEPDKTTAEPSKDFKAANQNDRPETKEEYEARMLGHMDQQDQERKSRDTGPGHAPD